VQTAVFSTIASLKPALNSDWDRNSQAALLQGEILLKTRPHSAWGGAVTASMYLPIARQAVWQQVTDYPRWVQYFPDLIRSEVLHCGDGLTQSGKRLYQVASKAFLFFSAQVEIYLKVFEVVSLGGASAAIPSTKDGARSGETQQIQFRLEKGNFHDFAADLKLQDYLNGTLLTYSVQATPTIPVPSQLIQQAIQLDLPSNMRRMRDVLCGVRK
jgi:hypothetical protein